MPCAYHVVMSPITFLTVLSSCLVIKHDITGDVKFGVWEISLVKYRFNMIKVPTVLNSPKSKFVLLDFGESLCNRIWTLQNLNFFCDFENLNLMQFAHVFADQYSESGAYTLQLFHRGEHSLWIWWQSERCWYRKRCCNTFCLHSPMGHLSPKSQLICS